MIKMIEYATIFSKTGIKLYEFFLHQKPPKIEETIDQLIKTVLLEERAGGGDTFHTINGVNLKTHVRNDLELVFVVVYQTDGPFAQIAVHGGYTGIHPPGQRGIVCAVYETTLEVKCWEINVGEGWGYYTMGSSGSDGGGPPPGGMDV